MQHTVYYIICLSTVLRIVRFSFTHFPYNHNHTSEGHQVVCYLILLIKLVRYKISHADENNIHLIAIVCIQLTVGIRTMIIL